MLAWLRSKLITPTPAEAQTMRAIEDAQALLARRKPHAALYHLTGPAPENPYVLASYLDIKIRAALALADLLLLDALGIHAQTLGRLRPEKARFLMLEAEALGAFTLALALADGVTEGGGKAADDRARIAKRRAARCADGAYLATAEQVLGGRFTDLRLVGMGDSSFVVSAVPAAGGEPVALKFLSPRTAMDERRRARFTREAALLNQLRHPNILRCDEFVEDDPPYMVTEFFPAPSLAQLLEQGRRFSADHTSRVGLHLCDALEAAHSKGIIHRDVKPGNVLVRGEEVKLIDFGLARTKAWEVSAQGTTLGDWAYMAPEQYEGTASSPAPTLDVFGIAATMHHMLTGSPPYRRDRLVLRERTSHLRDARGEIPPPLADLLRQGLIEDPRQRVPGAAAFAEGLRRAYLRRGG